MRYTLLPVSRCHFLDITAGLVESSSLLVSAELWLSNDDKRDANKPESDWLTNFMAHFQYWGCNIQLNTFLKDLSKTVICIIIYQDIQGSKIWLFLLDDVFNPLNKYKYRDKKSIWQTVFTLHYCHPWLFHCNSEQPVASKTISTVNITLLHSAFFCVVFRSWLDHFILIKKGERNRGTENMETDFELAQRF